MREVRWDGTGVFLMRSSHDVRSHSPVHTLNDKYIHVLAREAIVVAQKKRGGVGGGRQASRRWRMVRRLLWPGERTRDKMAGNAR